MDLSLVDYKPFKYKGKTPKSDWYNWLEPMAKALGREYGIPWQAILVQTALETAWGQSSLLSKYNNFGGIKDTDGINSTAPMTTTEYIGGKKITIKDGFEIYSSPYEGLKGYVQFFHKNKRYKNALKYPNDPYKFIEEIKKAGYATDPGYVAKLHSMLETQLKIPRA